MCKERHSGDAVCVCEKNITQKFKVCHEKIFFLGEKDEKGLLCEFFYKAFLTIRRSGLLLCFKIAQAWALPLA